MVQQCNFDGILDVKDQLENGVGSKIHTRRKFSKIVVFIAIMLFSCDYLYGQHYIGEIVDWGKYGYRKLIAGPYTEQYDATTYRNKITNNGSGQYADVMKFDGKYWVGKIASAPTKSNSPKLSQTQAQNNAYNQSTQDYSQQNINKENNNDLKIWQEGQIIFYQIQSDKTYEFNLIYDIKYESENADRKKEMLRVKRNRNGREILMSNSLSQRKITFIRYEIIKIYP